MKIYARMEGGDVAELFETDGDITQMFHSSIRWVDITTVSPAPQVGWSLEGATWIAPSGPAADAPWKALQAEALISLAKTDVTVLRCVEGGTTVPATWVRYRQTLRGIVGASTATTTELPTVPPYP